MNLKKKLIGAIGSLTLASMLTIGSTFAWFNLSTEVTVDSMQMKVRTAGSLYIRGHDYRFITAEGLGAYGVTYDPADVLNTGADTGVQPVASLEDMIAYYSAFDVSVVDLATLNTYLTGEGANNGWNTSDVNVQTFSESGVDRMAVPTSTDQALDFVYAEEQADYAKASIDILSADTNQYVTISSGALGSSVVTFTSVPGTYGAITSVQVAKDYLEAYRIEIVEFAPSVDTSNYTYTAPNEHAYVIASAVVLQAEIDGITTVADLESTDLFHLVWTFYDDSTGAEAANPDLGEFTADVARSFGIYYYVDGTASASFNANGDQNHLTEVSSNAVIQFETYERA